MRSPRRRTHHLKLAGTSTVYVLVENLWKKKYLDDRGMELAYESTGTTAGVRRLLDGESNIAFTHGALTPEQRRLAKARAGDVVQIPILFFGVAPVYHLKELKGQPPLNLTGETLAAIFLGKITRWDDPAIAGSNPGVALPKTPIVVVHRKDSSGTTLVFTEYLDAVTRASGAWRKKYGPPASAIKWPTGPNFVAAARNLGVATKVFQTEGSIGYVDRIFTSYGNMTLDYAAVQNRDRTGYIRAEPETMTAAAAGLLGNLPDDLVFDLANKPGKNAYPIAGIIYAVCFQNQPAETRQRVVDFLTWATHDGQALVTRLAEAPLPPELVQRIDQKLATITTVQ